MAANEEVAERQLLAESCHRDVSRGEERGLTKGEIRLDDALATNASAVRALTGETPKKMAHARTKNLRHNIAVDWSTRKRVRARLRLMVRRIVRPYTYPPDQQGGALEWVVQQAQALGKAWM